MPLIGLGTYSDAKNMGRSQGENGFGYGTGEAPNFVT
jgi:hypothetical protein